MCYKRIKKNLLGRITNLIQKKQYCYVNNHCSAYNKSNIKSCINFFSVEFNYVMTTPKNTFTKLS